MKNYRYSPNGPSFPVGMTKFYNSINQSINEAIKVQMIKVWTDPQSEDDHLNFVRGSPTELSFPLETTLFSCYLNHQIHLVFHFLRGLKLEGLVGWKVLLLFTLI